MWTAVSLWIFNLTVLAGYGALAVRNVAAGGSAAAWALALVALYFGLVFALCAAYFTIAWLWRSRGPREVRLDLRGTLRLAWREYLTLVGSPPRLMLFGLLMRDPAPARVDVPVLLVHGVLCNAGVWVRLARHLRASGVSGVYSMSYGPPLESIEVFAGQLADKIDDIVAATGARHVVVVAHSMGGLIVRAYIRRWGAGKVARVLTIGTPHHGSVHAWFCPGAGLAQMRPGSEWLAALNRERIGPAPRFVSLWSWHDSMVAPQTSSMLPGAVDVAIAGVGHNALLADPRVFTYVLDEISDARSEGA